MNYPFYRQLKDQREQQRVPFEEQVKYTLQNPTEAIHQAEYHRHMDGDNYKKTLLDALKDHPDATKEIIQEAEQAARNEDLKFEHMEFKMHQLPNPYGLAAQYSNDRQR